MSARLRVVLLTLAAALLNLAGCAAPPAGDPQTVGTVVHYSPHRRVCAVFEPASGRCEVRDLAAGGKLLWTADGASGEFLPSDDGRRLLRLAAPDAADGPLLSFLEDGMTVVEYGRAELFSDAVAGPWRKSPERIEDGVSDDGRTFELVVADGKAFRFDLLTGRIVAGAAGGRERAVEPIRRRFRELKAKPEIALRGKFAPAGIAADHRGDVYFTDASAGAIGRFGPSGNSPALYAGLAGGADAIALAPDGGLTVALRDDGKVVHIPPAAGAAIRVLAESYRDRRLLGPADLTYDVAGNLFFTDAGRAAGKTGAVYLLPPTGGLVQLVAGLEQPSGLLLIDGGRTLLVAEGRRDRILAYAVERGAAGATATGTPADAAAGLPTSVTLGRPRVFARLADGFHPKCLAADADGVVYALGATSDRIDVIAGNGEVVGRLDCGARRAGRMSFGGGADATTLLITHVEKGQGRIVRLDVGRPGAARPFPSKDAPIPAGGK